MTVTDFYKFNIKGESLESFIEKNKEILNGKRGFYILSFRMDKETSKKLFKIGVAHRSVYARLRSYVVTYGEQDSDCQGVQIHYLGTTNYNKDVQIKNSAIGKLEKKMILILTEGQYKVPRGNERFRLETRTLQNILNKTKKTVADTISKHSMTLKSKSKSTK